MDGPLLFTALVSASISALLTLGGCYALFRFYWQKHLEREAEALSERFRQELVAGFEESAEELLPRFREELGQAFEQAAAEMLPEFRRQLSEGFAERGGELLPEFRAEVSAGFREAAEEMLPEFRRQVRDGFKEALTEAAGGALIDETAKTMAKTGSQLVESGLNLLFGKNGSKKRDKS